MAYNTFSLEDLKVRFGLRVSEGARMFAEIPPAPISDLLRAELEENTPLALAISTEKARSEMLIAPILIEVRRQLGRTIGLHSGTEFSVDPERGLTGVCDFLLSLSPEQLAVEAPVVVVVEAKNENIKQGINQCIAEMVAAQLFNARRNTPACAVYGAVTTGSAWKFLRLAGEEVTLDLAEYYVTQVESIVGILIAMIKDARGTE